MRKGETNSGYFGAGHVTPLTCKAGHAVASIELQVLSSPITEMEIIMRFEKNKFVRSALGAAAVFIAGALLPGAASAQSAPPPLGWFKECKKEGDNDICFIQNIVRANSGQLVTAVGIITVQGKINRKILQVTVPPARLIPPGILMQINGSKGQKLDYAVCMSDKCIAEMALTDATIASLKKGSDLVVTSVNFQRTPNPIKISLSGFTGVFDGPAIEQSTLQERQRLLQEAVQKKADEAKKKLQDAQNAATQP